MAITGGGAGAQFPADGHLGDVADRDRGAVNPTDHHVFDIRDAVQLTRRAHQQLLPVALDVAGPLIAVIAAQCLGDLFQSDAELQQPFRRGGDVILLVVTADGVDLHHTAHLRQLRLDDPVLHFAQGGGIPGRTIRLRAAGGGVHGVDKDFTQAGGDRAHLWFQARGQGALDRGQTLVDQVAGKVQVGAFLEHHGHL